MSTASPLDLAREFLLLAPAEPADAVLQAARDRQAEWEAKLHDPRAPARLKEGAARKLRQLAPMLPLLEISAELGDMARAFSDPRSGKNQLLHLCELVAQKIAALPDGAEKSRLLSELEDRRDEAKAKAGTQVPIPPGTPPAGPDPALPEFETRLTGLRAAIDREDSNKLALLGLVAKANKAMSRLRDQGARDRAEREIDELDKQAQVLLLRATIKPVDFVGLAETHLAEAAAALDRGDLVAAPAPLAGAAALLPKLRSESREQLSPRHAALAARLRDLTLAAAADLAARKTAGDLLGALGAAIPLGDFSRASALLIRARTAIAAIVDPAARATAANRLSPLAGAVDNLRAEARARAEQQAAIDALLAEAHRLLASRDPAGSRKTLDQVRFSAAALSDPAAREAALSEVSALAARLAESPKPTVSRAQPPQTGGLLRLTPGEGSVVTGYLPVPLRLVARDRFIIGRYATESASLADFSVPLSETRVSRTHLTLLRKGDDILIHDGHGEKRGNGGSKLDEESLTPLPVPAGFSRERTISLGGVFSLSAQHLPTEGYAGPPQAADAFDTGGKTMVISLITGFMKFWAKADVHLPARVVWIFTDATLGTSPANAFALPHSGLADTHARIHFWQGAFWIETLRSGNAVRLGDRVLNKGEAVPLASGTTLHLGQLAYGVAIEP